MNARAPRASSHAPQRVQHLAHDGRRVRLRQPPALRDALEELSAAAALRHERERASARKFIDAVEAHDAAVACQLSHDVTFREDVLQLAVRAAGGTHRCERARGHRTKNDTHVARSPWRACPARAA
jgi:hypothetical protein